jgi:hypothetical protein
MSKIRILLVAPSVAVWTLTWAAACSSADPGVARPTLDGDGGAEGASTRPAEGAGPTGYTRIDDMEGTTGRVAWAPPGATVHGGWATNTDPAQYGRISPTPWTPWPDPMVPSPYETFPGITSAHAARVRTIQPLEGPGAFGGLGLAFAPPPGGVGGAPARIGFGIDPVDLRAYTGITFWAMADPNLDTTTLQVEIFDENTFPQGGACLDADGGMDDCYNGFGVNVELTGTFARYTVDFSTFAQDPTWGFHPVPAVLDLQNAYVLVFQINAPSGASSLSFDLWIDDVYFVDR